MRPARRRSLVPTATRWCRACAPTATAGSLRSTAPNSWPGWSPAWRSRATTWSASVPARSRNGPTRCRANLQCSPSEPRVMTKSCLAVRHVAFEDLGLLGPLVGARGYDVRYHDAGIDAFETDTLVAPDLVIVLGGPIGV